MLTNDLDYLFPAELIATEPRADYRILKGAMSASEKPVELNLGELFALFKSGDVLVINDTRVVKRRVFAGDLEILFIEPVQGAERAWRVLFPARDLKVGAKIALPGGLTATLKEKGLPQTLEVDGELAPEYFTVHGEFALPPYIQKARGERHSQDQDAKWYQTAWADQNKSGSCAAPTASLHFSESDLAKLKAKGVQIHRLTLHVGIGTFLPVKTDNLEDHKMHGEYIEIPASTLAAIKAAKQNGAKIWALGTTVARSLESYGQSLLEIDSSGRATGLSSLFIKPGFEWQWVDGLLTNFHQPKSTLVALVAAFAGLENVLASYAYAVEKRFRLFSYGDLSVWIK
jgi:S-adenosylmethionine:tRNA ribosyltransferase-isomerase